MATDHDDSLEVPRKPTQAELHALVERHLPVLRTFVRLNLGPVVRSKEAVSDIVQSAARELFETLDGFTFRGDDAFRGYLCQVAANKILEKKRYYLAQKRDAGREEALDAEDYYELADVEGDSNPRSPQKIAMRREELARLQELFDALDERDRRILSMRRIFGIPATEIARELGIGESTVRWRLSEIMTKLAEGLR
ncbi:MAG: sigma-70 family RNA polymerase sigma factor [Planctomycetes bacterium]|nr:sigma-70 family RNA polymerase sigma factor [Planctomycetota bacterium]